MARIWRGAGGPRITKRRSKASTSAGGAGSSGSVARQQVGTQTLSPNLGPLLTDLLNSDVDHWLFNENHPIVGSAEANAAEDVHADSPNANMDRRGSPLHTDVSDRASLNATNPERNEDVDPDRRFRGINRCNVGEPVVDKLPLGILGGKLSPLDAIRHVTATLHLHWPGPFMSWAAVPPLSQGTIWTKFKLTYNVPLEKEELYRKAFDLVAADRYRSILSSACKEAAKVNGSDNPKDWVKHPDWMDEGDWKVLLNEWMSDAWQLKSTRNRKNRLTKKDGTIPTHSGGSVSFAEHRSRMAEELGREPTFEEWFANMHRNKKAPAEFVDNRAKRVLEEYKALKLAKYGTAENAARVDFDLALWKKACGGKTKGRLYGVGRYMYAMQGVSRAPMGEELLFTRSQLEAAVAEGINAARPRLISEVLAAVQGKDGVQGMQGVVSTSNEDGQPAVVQGNLGVVSMSNEDGQSAD